MIIKKKKKIQLNKILIKKDILMNKNIISGNHPI